MLTDVKGEWYQQALAHNTVTGLGVFHLLVNDALMGRMGIHHNQPVTILRQDINAVQLSDGVAQRMCAGFGLCRWPQMLIAMNPKCLGPLTALFHSDRAVTRGRYTALLLMLVNQLRKATDGLIVLGRR